MVVDRVQLNCVKLIIKQMSLNNFINLVCLIISASIISSCSNSSQDSKSIEIINAHYSPNEVSSNIAPASEQHIDFQMKLWLKGIDFYARGNEPFWALDMDFDKGFYFKTLNGIEINTPPFDGQKAMDTLNNGLFTSVLLREIAKKPSTKIQDLLDDVRLEVEKLSEGDQVPAFDTNVRGKFCFNTEIMGRCEQAN